MVIEPDLLVLGLFLKMGSLQDLLQIMQLTDVLVYTSWKLE